MTTARTDRASLQEESSIRHWFTGAACTLNGKPAKITGGMMDYATVAALDGSCAFAWSWAAVERIMANGGRFRS